MDRGADGAGWHGFVHDRSVHSVHLQCEEMPQNKAMHGNAAMRMFDGASLNRLSPQFLTVDILLQFFQLPLVERAKDWNCQMHIWLITSYYIIYSYNYINIILLSKIVKFCHVFVMFKCFWKSSLPFVIFLFVALWQGGTTHGYLGAAPLRAHGSSSAANERIFSTLGRKKSLNTWEPAAAEGSPSGLVFLEGILY